jgi:hypothetical protein
MNAGNMPPQGGGGGKPMKNADPDTYGIVYGKKGTIAIDYDGDGRADSRNSGEAPLWVIDSKHWWSIVVAFRALISSAWHNKFYAAMLFFALLGIIPATWMGVLALASSNARQLTNAEAGGLSGAIGNNLVVNLKGAVSAPAAAIYDRTVADNLKSSSDIALSTPREARAARR